MSVMIFSPMDVVLLACGSYNPVTNMHLRMFEIARDALNKSGRYKVLSGVISPVSDNYKKKNLVSINHRCKMLKSALETSDWITLDTWEGKQSSWTPTAEVLRHHKQKIESEHNFIHKPSPSKRRKKHSNSVSDIPENQLPSLEIVDNHIPCVKLLCGGDLLESFAEPGLWNPKDIEYIVGTHGLVVITRYGSDPLKFIYESDILTKFKENIFIVTEWIYNDISSTKIRRALSRGESVRYLLQDPVINYIQEHQLYGASKNKDINCNVLSSKQVMTEKTSSSQEEAEVILESSSQQNGFSCIHLPIHRMTTRLGKCSATSSTSNKSTVVSVNEAQVTGLGILMRRVKNVRFSFAPGTCV